MAFEKVKEHIKSLSARDKTTKTSPFRYWAVAFVVCNFNVDLGPEIELVYPVDTHFSTADLSAICFNSFPETQDTELADDLIFNFTIPNTSPDIPLVSPCPPHGSATDLYGSCFFRQEFDKQTKRSFNQKTLVLISNQDFPSLFSKLLQITVNSGYISDPPVLEAAVRQIESWEPPSVGQHELPYLGNVLAVEIAPHPAFALQGLLHAVSQGSRIATLPIYAYAPVGSWENDLIQYMPSISELFVLFEKLVLCESIVVLAKSPQACSQLVSCAIDLIRPVPYAGVVRPYLVMQSEFNTVGPDGGLPRNFVIGITNPFMLRRIVDSIQRSNRSMPHIIYLDRTDGVVPIKGHGMQLPPGTDVPNGLISHRSHVKRLKTEHEFSHVLTQLMKQSPNPVGQDIDSHIRRHFAELAAQFLAPINRYLATGVALEATTPGGNPKYGNFNEASFLKSLAKHGTALDFKGQSPIQRRRARDHFYETFCRSPNFYSWLAMKLSLEREASAGLLNDAGNNSKAIQ